MKRKTNSSSRRPAFPILLGIVGLLLWVVSPLDAQPISDAEHRTNLQELIRRIDAGEVLFVEAGGEIAPFYPHEVPASELARARIATRVVRERLQDELDALETAKGSRNPTTLIPESRPHREPPPVDWAVEGISKEERCASLRERIAESQGERSRLEEEAATLDEGLKGVREELDRIDAAAEGDPATAAIRASLFTANLAGKIPAKHQSLLEPGNVGRLEEFARVASVGCNRSEVLSGAAMIFTDYGWACDYIPEPSRLRGLIARAEERERVRGERDYDVRAREMEGKRKELSELTARIHAHEREAILLGCPDEQPPAPLAQDPSRISGSYEAFLTGFHPEYGDGPHFARLLINRYDCPSDPCRITGLLDLGPSWRFEGELRGTSFQVRSYDRGSDRRYFALRGAIEAGGTPNGTWEHLDRSGKLHRGTWTATLKNPW